MLSTVPINPSVYRTTTANPNYNRRPNKLNRKEKKTQAKVKLKSSYSHIVTIASFDKTRLQSFQYSFTAVKIIQLKKHFIRKRRRKIKKNGE